MSQIDLNEYLKADKLSDDIHPLGLNYTLKMNVSLSSNGGGNRHHFHKEYEYPSRTDDIKSLVTIKRSFDYYLSIESNHKDDNGNKVFIRIGTSEYYAVKKGLDMAYDWFTGDKYKKLFAVNNGKIVLMPPVPEYTVAGLPMGKYLYMVPVIVERGMAEADKIPGLRIYLSSDSVYTDLVIDKFMGLHYVYSTLSMYQAAIELINYLGRPDFGFNRFSMMQQEDNQEHNNQQQYIKRPKPVAGRFVTPQNKSN